jgi:hypothetical protein
METPTTDQPHGVWADDETMQAKPCFAGTATLDYYNAGAVIFASWVGPEDGLVAIESKLAGAEPRLIAAVIEHFGLEEIQTEKISPAQYRTWYRGTRNHSERLNYPAYKEVMDDED